MIRVLYLISPLECEKLRVFLGGGGGVGKLWQLNANKITLWNNDNVILNHQQGKKKKKNWVRRQGVLICTKMQPSHHLQHHGDSIVKF